MYRFGIGDDKSNWNKSLYNPIVKKVLVALKRLTKACDRCAIKTIF